MIAFCLELSRDQLVITNFVYIYRFLFFIDELDRLDEPSVSFKSEDNVKPFARRIAPRKGMFFLSPSYPIVVLITPCRILTRWPVLDSTLGVLA
jgi:hypothetical protein